MDEDMETWKYGEMETWRHGHGDIETWTWTHGHGDTEIKYCGILKFYTKNKTENGKTEV
jgi:hypothetical protein